MQPMVFGWDAYYLPRWSFGYESFFLSVSHDSFVTVVTRTTAFYEKAFRILEGLQLQPQAAYEPQRQCFCRVQPDDN